MKTGKPEKPSLQMLYIFACVFTCVLRWLRAIAKPNQNANEAVRDRKNLPGKEELMS